jgi:hypothetical protein
MHSLAGFLGFGRGEKADRLASQIARFDASRFFLCGGIKRAINACSGQVVNLDVLTRRINADIAALAPEMSRRVWAKISYLLDICILTTETHEKIY